MTSVLLIVLATLLPPRSAAAQDGVRDFPLSVTKVTDRVIVIATGATPAMPNVTAVKTDDGIVVFDSGMIPSYGTRIRNLIESTFGSGHIAYLILTHAAYDHSFGDVAYPDVPIIGQAFLPAELQRYMTTMGAEGMAARVEESNRRMAKAMESLPLDYAGYDERLAGEETRASLAMMVRELSGGAVPRLPTITFSDRMTLAHGGMTFHMQVGAGVYEKSNMLIEIPEEHVLILGDEFNKERLPFLGPNSDISLLADEMVPFLDGSKEIEHFIPGHGELMSAAEIQEQVMYAVELQKAVKAARAEGLSLDETRMQLRFEAFGRLQDLPRFFYGYPIDGHDANIRQLWGPPAP